MFKYFLHKFATTNILELMLLRDVEKLRIMIQNSDEISDDIKEKTLLEFRDFKTKLLKNSMKESSKSDDRK